MKPTHPHHKQIPLKLSRAPRRFKIKMGNANPQKLSRKPTPGKKPKRYKAATAEERSLAAKIIGRLGGLVTSDAKAKAARKNGKKGGRPRNHALWQNRQYKHRLWLKEHYDKIPTANIHTAERSRKHGKKKAENPRTNGTSTR